MSTEKRFTDGVLSADAKAVLGVICEGLPMVGHGKFSERYITFCGQVGAEEDSMVRQTNANVTKGMYPLTFGAFKQGLPELLVKAGLVVGDNFTKKDDPRDMEDAKEEKDDKSGQSHSIEFRIKSTAIDAIENKFLPGLIQEREARKTIDAVREAEASKARERLAETYQKKKEATQYWVEHYKNTPKSSLDGTANPHNQR